MNSSEHLQTEESGIGNDIYYAASSVSPNANHEVQRYPLFTVDHTPNQQPMLHRDWRIKNFRIQIAKSYFFNVLHPFGTETYVFLLGKWRSIAIKPIYLLFWQQFNIWTDFFQLKMVKALTIDPQMTKMNIHIFRTLQRPLSSQKIFLEHFLTVQLSTGRLK